MIPRYYSSPYHEHDTLIVLPTMKFAYFENDPTLGYHMFSALYGRNIHLLLEDSSLEEPGAYFRIHKHSYQIPERTAILEIYQHQRSRRKRYILYSYLWHEFISGLRIIQRLAHRQSYRRLFRSGGGGDPFHLRKLKAFMGSERGSQLPRDVIDVIIVQTQEFKSH